MKSKSLFGFVVFSLIMSLSLVSSAKPQIKKINIGTQVKLQCAPAGGGDVVSTLKVTNKTGSAVPADTLVFLSTNIGNTKSRITSPIPNNTFKYFDGPAGDPGSCQAWYMK